MIRHFNSTGRRPSTNTPEMRGVQFGGGQVGDIKDSVNMFRGDVNHDIPLFEIPGRNDLSIKVGLFYGSNVHGLVDTWNLEAPTGTLGLGWSLPFHQIAVADGGGAAPSSNTYYLVDGERAEKLIPRQRLRSGDIMYETEVYRFWSIVYEARNERWVVTKTDGTKYIYGGTESDANAVQWSVAWGAQDAPNWTGPSAKAEGQRQYATAWNLARVEDLSGDFLDYAYDAVMQNVGGHGSSYKAYTKASYLKSITDVLGRQVVFDYEEKVCSPGDGICEYQDPHKVLTSPSDAGTPDAYQSRYETRYLSGLRALDESGAELFSYAFDYDLRNFSTVPNGDENHKFLYKRCLTGVRRLAPDGAGLAGYHFDYWPRSDQGSKQENPHPGALKSVTYPSGGTATYVYQTEEVTGEGVDPTMPLRHRIDAPWSGSKVTPRVWFGPDYTVVTWYDGERAALGVYVYRWVGRWVSWRAPDVIQGQVKLETLAVVPRDDYFCLTFANESHGKQNVHLFRKDNSSFGQWSQSEFSVPMSDTGTHTLVAAGGGYVMLCNPGFNGGPYQGWSWSAFERRWVPISALPQGPAGDNVRYFVTGHDNYILAASFTPDAPDKDEGTAEFTLIYRDPVELSGNGWQVGGTWRRNITVFGAGDSSNDFFFTMSGGATFAIATYITAARNDPREVDYTLLAYSWNGRYQVPGAEPFHKSYTVPVGDEIDLPVFETGIYQNAMVANSGNLLRYIGGMETVPQQTWLATDRQGGNDGDFTFAYALDAGVTYNADGGGTTMLTTFDPNHPNPGGWASRYLDSGRNSPTMLGDYMTSGSAVHYRGPRNDWQKLPTGLGGSTADGTVDNRAPSYFVYEDTSKRAVHVAFPKNGRIESDRETLSDPAQRCHVDDGKLGTNLAGPSMFVTYPADQEFEQAQTLYLYHVLEGTVTGKVTTRNVHCVRIDDAWPHNEPYEQHYAYSPDMVSYDPATGIAQFAKTTLLPASRHGKHGYSITYYSNGLSRPPQWGAGGVVSYNHLLNGAPLREETYDAEGNLVSSITHDYQVYRSRQTGVGGGSTNVAGAWVRKVGEVEELDGVSRSRSYEWDHFSGQSTKQTRDDYDDNGKKVTLSKSMTYGYEVSSYSSWMLSNNVLNAVVSEQKSTDDTITSISVSTWKKWCDDRWGTCVTAKWKGTGSSDFDFDKWSSGEGVSDDWVVVDTVLARSSDGLVPECRANVDGVVSSVAYAKNASRPVATFPGADTRGPEASVPGDAAYWGMEAYEVNPGWRIEPGGGDPSDYITDVNPRVGKTCLEVPADSKNGKGPQIEVEPNRQDQTFILSCWVRTGSGFSAGARAAWHIEAVKPDGGTVDTRTTQIPDTDGKWTYVSIPVDLAKIRKDNGIDAGTKLRLRLHARNKGDSAAYYLDALRFTPLDCDFTATTFDAALLDITGKVGPRGEISTSVYDPFMRRILDVGPSDGVFKEIKTLHQADKSQNGSTSAPNPDSALSIQPRKAGVFDDFRAESLSSVWSLKGPGSWTTDPKNRSLVHAHSDNPETLQLTPTGHYGASYGVQLTVAPTSASPEESILLAIGDALSVGWDPDAGGWALRDGNGGTVATQKQSALASGRWTVVIAGTLCMFFFDGRQIFGHDFGSELSGTFAIKTAADVGFKAVCAFPAPSMTMQYRDGAARERQNHAFDGQSWIVNETVHDALGREAIETKPVPREGTAFGVWSDFVTGVDWDGDGKMTGAVSDYYSEGGGGFTDDEGYPFSRTSFETSPVSRANEQARPGKALGLNPGAGHDDRHTTRVARTKNAGMHHLPPGKYFQITVTGEDGHRDVEIRNSREQTLLKETPIKGPDGASEGSLTMAYHYDAAGNVIEIKLPNAFQPRKESEAGKAVLRMQHDFFGRVITETSYNRGDPGDPDKPRIVRYMYDNAGRERFYQSPDLRMAGRIGYYKYDRLGRQIEAGETEFDWTEANEPALRAHAEDPSWPSDERHWTQRLVYDGDGQDPNAILRMVEASSKAADVDDPTCVETFAYDLDGRVETKSMSVPEFDDTERRLAFAYDTQDNITRMTVNDGARDHVIAYERNAYGAITKISRGSDALASYTYVPVGGVATETFHGSSSLVRTFEYNSPGWITRIGDDRFFEQTIAYYGNSDSANYYDGKPAATTVHEKWRDGADPLRASYAYDTLGRLRRATGGAHASDDEVETFSYDANGNVLQVGGGDGTRMAYTYDGATDRVKETTGQLASTYTYDLEGNVTGVSGRKLTLRFDSASGRVSTAIVSGDEGCRLDYVYDNQGQRVLVDGAEGEEGRKRLYLRDLDGRPVVELSVGGSGRPETRLYVYGATGALIATEIGETRYFVLSDMLGSSRVVVGDDLTFKAGYRYGLYGEQVATDGDTTLLRYLFTGQELDGETGLYNFNARLYDPVLRRFYSMDPEQEFASPYVYAAGNPLSSTDPSGRALISLGVAILVGAIVGAVAGLAAGVAVAVSQRWSVGEAAWKVTLLTLLGAASGAIFAAAAQAGAAAGAAAAAAAGWKGTTAGSVLAGGIELGFWASAGTALGASDGAAYAAITGGDPATEAGYEALAGLIGSVVYFGASKAASGIARYVVNRSIRGKPEYFTRVAARDPEFGQPTAFEKVPNKTGPRRTAIAETVAGTAAGSVGALGGQAVDMAKGRTDAGTVVRNTLLGGLFGGMRTAPGEYVTYKQSVRVQATYASPQAATMDSDAGL